VPLIAGGPGKIAWKLKHGASSLSCGQASKYEYLPPIGSHPGIPNEDCWEAMMIHLSGVTKLSSAFVVAAVMLIGAPALSYAENGSVRMKISKVGFIVGVGGGSGTLTFKGKQYRLDIGGVSAGTIGVASMDLVGSATNLTTAADIAGSYSAASAGLAVAGGTKVATLQNAKGVVLQLQGRQVGFEASLAVSGMTISLK
jgi:hypothetical protein